MKVQLKNFANFCRNPYRFAETVDNPKYWMRSPNISNKKVKLLRNYLEANIDKEKNKFALAFLNKVCNIEASEFIAVGQPRNYRINDYGLYTDPYMLHECLGLMTYSKDYQIIYNLNECLAEIIAMLTNGDVKKIKQVLTEHLTAEGIKYENYSANILGQYRTSASPSLSHILTLVPELDQIIKTQRCYLLNNCCSIHSMPIEGYDSEKDIPILLDLVICGIFQDVQQCILDAVFDYFEAYKINNNSKVEAVTSNGSGCLVVQANNPNVAEDIELYTHDNQYIGTISPEINHNYSYAEAYINKLTSEVN